MRVFSDNLAEFFLSIIRTFFSSQVFTFIIAGNIILFPAAGLFYMAEEAVNPHVDSYIDALWWAFVTVTTVGYGDIWPVTNLGRIMAISLMIGGATCFVGFTATFVKRFLADYHTDEAPAETQIKEMNERLSRMEEQLQKLISKN